MQDETNSGGLKGELEQVRSARRLVDKVHRALLQPTIEAFDTGAADLNVAAKCLEQLQIALAQRHGSAPVPSILASEMKNLRDELKAVGELVAGAGRFLAGWARLIASDDQSPNYSSKGQAGVPIPSETAGVVMHG